MLTWEEWEANYNKYKAEEKKLVYKTIHYEPMGFAVTDKEIYDAKRAGFLAKEARENGNYKPTKASMCV